MKFPIYLDHNATSPCDPQVLEAMLPWFTEAYGNASSRQHVYGWMAEEAVESAREQIAALIGAEAKEVFFTSGATEAINLAIRGLMEANAHKGNHLITVATEHKAVLDTCEAVRKKGVEVTCLSVKKDGSIDLEMLESAIKEETVMVIVMTANNETGVFQPIAEIGALTKKHQLFFLSDAVQAVGKIPLSVKDSGIDLMPISAHKMYGPKGIGALYVRHGRRQVDLVSQMTGGGHERGLRSGTLNVPAIVGFGKAAEIAKQEMDQDHVRLSGLRDYLENGLLEIEGTQINGNPRFRLPHVSNISFEGVEAKNLLIAVNKELAVSSGSACSSVTTKPSHVLSAMGLGDELARSSLRFGLGRSTTQTQVDFAVQYVKETVNALRKEKLEGSKYYFK